MVVVFDYVVRVDVFRISRPSIGFFPGRGKAAALADVAETKPTGNIIIGFLLVNVFVGNRAFDHDPQATLQALCGLLSGRIASLPRLSLCRRACSCYKPHCRQPTLRPAGDRFDGI